MSTDQERWDARYSETSPQPKVANVILENQSLLPTRGKALDLACGLGGNALFLAEQGLEVEAWDISPIAIKKLNRLAEGLPVTARIVDITQTEWPLETFDVIVVSYYLERSISQKIVDALKPGGLLFYETFNQNILERGPKNPAYRLKEKELLEMFNGLTVRYYSEDNCCDTTRMVAEK